MGGGLPPGNQNGTYGNTSNKMVPITSTANIIVSSNLARNIYLSVFTKFQDQVLRHFRGMCKKIMKH